MRGPEPLAPPLGASMTAELGGCMAPDGGGFELRDGDGEDWEDFTPLTPVCTEGGGGRFIFCCIGVGLAATAVAMTPRDRVRPN